MKKIKVEVRELMRGFFAPMNRETGRWYESEQQLWRACCCMDKSGFYPKHYYETPAVQKYIRFPYTVLEFIPVHNAPSDMEHHLFKTPMEAEAFIMSESVKKENKKHAYVLSQSGVNVHIEYATYQNGKKI